MLRNRCPGRLAVLAVLTGASACTPTRYSLISEDDPLRTLIVEAEPPAAWNGIEFDDAAWSLEAGAIPMVEGDGSLGGSGGSGGKTVCLRRRFDVGPEAAAYRELDLTVGASGGSFIAYVNGAQVATVVGRFSVPVGLLRAADNVLAVELRLPAGVQSVAAGLRLDGDPAPGIAVASARGPFLSAPTPSGVTVVWETATAASSRLVVDGHAYDGGAGTHHQVTIADLQPSRAYDYFVETGGARTETSTLTTAPLPGERLRFVVYGDNRTNGDVHRRVALAIRDEGPDFLLNTGDLVNDSTPSEWQSFFNIEYALLRSVPLFPSIGNHELKGAAHRFLELFPVSAGLPYYGADFGDLHVAVLDSNGDLARQASWLDTDLAQARARGARHLFLMMHHGPFSSGTSIAHGGNEDARDHIVPVARRHGVAAVFAGHDHFYERGRSGGLTYFVTGGGGAPLHSAGRIAETLVSKTAHHYLVVDVSGGQVTLSAKTPSGEIFDTVDL